MNFSVILYWYRTCVQSLHMHKHCIFFLSTHPLAHTLYASPQVQADFLQAKLGEESGKRQRAEERCRVLKNYSEKAKVGII